MIRTLMVLSLATAVVAGCGEKDTEKTPSEAENPRQQAPDQVLADAQKILDQVTAYISQGKFGEAEAGLKQLDARRDKLPRQLTEQLDTLREALKAAKAAAGGTRLPAIPNIGG